MKGDATINAAEMLGVRGGKCKDGCKKACKPGHKSGTIVKADDDPLEESTLLPTLRR